MKTYISITGQTNGNSKLKSVINGGDLKKLGNNYYIQYQTKKEAVKELKQAFKQLKENEQDYFKEGGINYSQLFLEYDASTAKIWIGSI